MKLSQEESALIDALTEKVINKEITIAEISKAVIEQMRENLYKQFPTLNPFAVETLLLLYEEMTNTWIQNIDKLSQSQLVSDFEEQYIQQIRELASAIRRVAERLTS